MMKVAVMQGGRSGPMSVLRRLIAAAMAQDLTAMVVPGPDLARASGLDLAGAGLRLAATPRHASVLLILGPLPKGLRDAATVAYAQMPRPRAILALGAGDLAPLPVADVTGDLSQAGLIRALTQLRERVKAGAFGADIVDFDAPALQVRIEFTCPMHPEVIRDEPGACPKCGMTLVPRETAASGHDGHAAAGHGATASHGSEDAAEGHRSHGVSAQNNHGNHGDDHGGHGGQRDQGRDAALPLVSNSDAHKHRTAKPPYSCPMHPEVVSDKPGNCPKCGMILVKPGADAAEHGHRGHAHGGHSPRDGHGQDSYAEHDAHKHEAQDQDGHGHSGHGHGKHGQDDKAAVQYTCPMHPEVVSDTLGNCPKCGMTLVKPGEDAGEHEHGGHGHDGHSPHDSHGQDSRAEHDAHKHEAPSHSGHGHSGHGHGSHGKDDKAAVQYSCPMHREVVSDTPGNCPKCGMTLVKPGEADAEHVHSGHGHDGNSPHEGHGQDSHADHDAHKHEAQAHGGHGHSGHGHGKHGQDDKAAATYTCPMHPEVVSDAPGSCPKCGMFLVEAEPAAADDPGDHGEQSGHSAHSGHGEHSGHGGHGTAEEQIDGIEPGFMSMVDLTKDMPASPDGLKMEWIDVAFGPFFPGLPGGLGLSFTLDGDTVAAAQAQGLAGTAIELPEQGMAPADFADSLAAQTPLSPVAMRQLVSLALQNATGVRIADDLAMAHLAAVERERICSHLGWIAAFAGQSGLIALERRAGKLQLALRKASTDEITHQSGAVTRLLRRLQRTPMLRSKLVSIGTFDESSGFSGPVARAAGIATDARQDDPLYQRLGFSLISGSEGDAMARLTLRCDEIIQSLELIARAGTPSLPQGSGFDAVSGHGSAVVETPRGAATLSLRLESGKITEASLVTPSAALLACVGDLTHQMELADALVAVASLDLDPWGAPV